MDFKLHVLSYFSYLLLLKLPSLSPVLAILITIAMFLYAECLAIFPSLGVNNLLKNVFIV